MANLVLFQEFPPYFALDPGSYDKCSFKNGYWTFYRGFDRILLRIQAHKINVRSRVANLVVLQGFPPYFASDPGS